MKADLHLHTYYSDGTDSPAELVGRAAKAAFDVVAVTDHDTLDGIPETLAAGLRVGVKVVPGVEITAQWNRVELHLLAYFSPEDDAGRGWQHPELIQELRCFAQHRNDRAGKIVARLNTLGIPLVLEDVQRQAGKGTIGRPHVAAAMVERKFVASLNQAFAEFLKRGRPAWVDKPRAEARDTIALVHRAGGIVILAHPGFLPDSDIVSQLFEQGLDGLEVYHSRHHPVQSARFLEMARRHKLLVTGGSDCHGELKGEPLLGRIEFTGSDLDRFLARIGNLKGVISNP